MFMKKLYNVYKGRKCLGNLTAYEKTVHITVAQKSRGHFLVRNKMKTIFVNGNIYL